MTFFTLLQNRPTGESIQVDLPSLQVESVLQAPRFLLTTPATYVGSGRVFERIEVRLPPITRRTRLSAPLFKVSEDLRVLIPTLRSSVQCLPPEFSIRYSKRRQADEDDLLLGLFL